MLKSLRSLWNFRDLLYMLTWRDIAIRYKQSIMGFLWALLMPSLIVSAGVLVRVAFATYTGTELRAEDIHSIMVRAVIWAFFVSSVRFGTNCLVGNDALITRIAFPKEVFPLSAVTSNLFDFFVATVTVFLALVLSGWQPALTALWFLPLLFILIVLCLGSALFLSAANLFFRDVKYLVEIFLTYAILFSPVFYDASMLGAWESVILLNPVAPILEGVADAVVAHRAPDAGWITYSATFALVTLVFSYWLFKELEAKFAESL